MAFVNNQIEKPKLLIAEGVDARNFLIYACRDFGPTDFQVLDYGGVKDLRTYLQTLRLVPNFAIVESLVVVRDAEMDSDAAVASVKSSLQDADFPVPMHPFEYAGNAPKVAFMIFPGYDEPRGLAERKLLNGALEHLCIKIAKDQSAFPCVESHIECLNNKLINLTHPHKTKLHLYLSSNNKYVGQKIGEAAKAGAWDWSHEALSDFRTIIQTM